MVLAGFISVIPQVYWPGAAQAEAGGPPLTGEPCAPALDALHADLTQHLITSMGDASLAADPSEQSAAHLSFFARWDERHHSLATTCANVPAYSVLLRLRHAIEGELDRVGSDVAPLARDTAHALAASR